MAGDAPVIPAPPIPGWLKVMADHQTRIQALVSSMPPRHVKFARLVAEGQTQTQAAIDAGYTRVHAGQAGHRCGEDPDVKALVEALQTFDILTETAITRPALRQVLANVMNDGSNTDKVAAVRAAIKLEGYATTRVEVTGAVSAISAEDLRRQLAERLARQQTKTDE